jgi:hypothetical protein
MFAKEKSMTKKDFEILAAEIAKLINAETRLNAAAAVAAACIKINPRFDVNRFFKACNL